MSHSTETLPVLIADRYQIVRQLGIGNMSTVYEALDHHASQRSLAIKLLDSQHAAGLKYEFFKRETRALERLEHPHIITLFDANWDPAQQCFYLALEYLPQTLTDIIQRHADDQDNAWCWPLMESLVDALVYAHSEGVIHRDLKSSNILIAADGTPKLTDFNISHLKFELSSGMTVGEFFSVGFASPEQIAHQPVTEKSDLYSLGCVFYHLLARQAPPTDGITPERVRALHLHKVVEGMLLEVLATDPANRMPTALQLQRRLTALQNLTPPATIYVQVTQRARRELADKGFLNHNTNEAAAARLQQEFDDAAQVAVIHDGQETWRILTDQMQLLCGRDATIPMLIIKTIHFAYDPEQERLRAQATPARFAWQVIDGLRVTQPPLASYPTAHATLNVFGEQLMSKAVARSTQRVQERARRDLVGTWQKVIAFQQQQLVKANRLRYTAFKKTGGTFTFTLRDLIPDDLDWPDSAPMGVFDDAADLRGVSIGEFLRVQGKEVQIAMNMLALGVGTGIERLPATGWLGIYQQEVAVSLRRQKYALGVVRTGGTHNPDLPAVLLDVSTARFNPVETDLQFFQTHLGEDKRQAVRQALATQDIFILQGPPGTGKTTTLAEIVLQIRRRTPNARILISSQSNVATDHILSRVAAISGDTLTEIVRIGRPQKIGQAAQEWTIDQRMVAWRESVLSRTTPVLAELKQRIAMRRRLQQQATTFTEDYVADLEQCQLLLTDVDQEMAVIADLDRQCTAITTHAPRGKLTGDAQQAITERREAIAEHERSVRVLVDLILAYIPAELQPVLVGSLPTDVEQIKQMIARLMQQETQDDDTALLTLVNRWRQVFGRTTDFAEPILARADIMAATCLTTGGHYFQDETFDWAIIDEAGRATAPELLVPLVRARRAILCGDERQLPPMLDDQLDPATLTQLGTSVEELGESLFAALAAQGAVNAIPAVQMLTAQHRMHPAIGRMVSAVFYEGLLTHAVQAHERVHQLPWISRPVIWYTTQHLPHHAETSVGKSFYNRAEVSGIHDLLLRMEESYREAGERRELAIITPYQPQIAELTATIMPQSPLWLALDIEIATVDAFQGRDRDIVIYSTVRANETGNIGFLRDRRRLNVALSRARQLLVIVGDIVTLERAPLGKGGNPYRELAQYLRDHPEDCMVLPLEGGAKR